MTSHGKLRPGQAVLLRRLTTYDPQGGAERITRKHVADVQSGPDGLLVRFREGPYRWYHFHDDEFRAFRPTARYELVYEHEGASVSKRRKKRGFGNVDAYVRRRRAGARARTVAVSRGPEWPPPPPRKAPFKPRGTEILGAFLWHREHSSSEGRGKRIVSIARRIANKHCRSVRIGWHGQSSKWLVYTGREVPAGVEPLSVKKINPNDCWKHGYRRNPRQQK